MYLWYKRKIIYLANQKKKKKKKKKERKTLQLKSNLCSKE